jgi:hypothetical protein
MTISRLLDTTQPDFWITSQNREPAVPGKHDFRFSRCGSSKLNAAESSMQDALSLEGSALHGVVFDR